MKRFVSALLCILVIMSASLCAYAGDAYCTLQCENHTVSEEAAVTGIYNLDYSAGDAENVTFRCTYDEKIINVDVYTEDGRTELFIEGIKKGETTLLIEMLSESGDVLACDSVNVSVSAFPIGDIFKSMLETAEYYLILFFGHILPAVITAPFNYIAGLIK